MVKSWLLLPGCQNCFVLMTREWDIAVCAFNECTYCELESQTFIVLSPFKTLYMHKWKVNCSKASILYIRNRIISELQVHIHWSATTLKPPVWYRPGPSRAVITAVPCQDTGTGPLTGNVSPRTGTRGVGPLFRPWFHRIHWVLYSTGIWGI